MFAFDTHAHPFTSESRGSKIRVDNIHYELTQEDLEVGLQEAITGKKKTILIQL